MTAAIIALYVVSLAVVIALYRAVAREDRRKGDTATPEAWQNGVESLNAFRERTRGRKKHHA